MSEQQNIESTQSAESVEPTEKKKRKPYNRRSPEQKRKDDKAEALATLRRIEQEEAIERMGDNPVMQKVASIRAKLTERSTIDGNLVNGYGKGRPVVERIKAMRAELKDLEQSAERAVGFLKDVEAIEAGLDGIQAQVLAGDFDDPSTHNSADFSFVTDSYRGWKETDTERNRRLEREARAAKRAETQAQAEQAQEETTEQPEQLENPTEVPEPAQS